MSETTWNRLYGDGSCILSVLRAGKDIRSVPKAYIDVDDTLIKGASGFSFIDLLKDNGMFDGNVYDYFQMMARKYRNGKMSQDGAAVSLAWFYSRGMKGRRLREAEQAAEYAFEKLDFRKNVYDGIETLKRRGISPVLISSSPSEIIRVIAGKLEVPLFFGAPVPIEGCVYTGERPGFFITSRAKGFVVDALGSPEMAIGDSMGDEPMLSRAKNPIAFNPRGGLETTATKRGWKVVKSDDFMDCLK
jgi:phosphoserine phosphatase